MKEPTLDSEGYPSEESLIYISHDRYNVKALDFAEKIYNKHYGVWKIVDEYDKLFNREPFNALVIATGGYSGNESIINALKQTIIWEITWQASFSGGLHILNKKQIDDCVSSFAKT